MSRVMGVVLVLWGASALTGCTTDEEGSFADDEARFAVPPGSYVAPAEGCPNATLADVPVLAMPGRGGLELFMASPQHVGQLAIDYDVSPAPRVTRLHIDFLSDPLVPMPPLDVESHCPESVDTSLFVPTEVTNDVMAVRVSALDEEGDGRFADVFFPVGDQVLAVDTSGVPGHLPEGAAWYLVYEPGWGSHRAAVFEVAAPGTVQEIAGLPRGPATVALLQTDALRRDGDMSPLYGPPAFAADWIVWTQALHAAVIPKIPDEPIPLEPIVPHGERAWVSNLADDVLLTAQEPYAAVAAPPAGGRGAVRASCGASVDLWVGGFAVLTVFPEADEPLEAKHGERVQVQPACTPGDNSGSILIDVRPQNGRSVNIVASLAGAL
jgi:hypothetical protein